MLCSAHCTRRCALPWPSCASRAPWHGQPMKPSQGLSRMWIRTRDVSRSKLARTTSWNSARRQHSCTTSRAATSWKSREQGSTPPLFVGKKGCSGQTSAVRCGSNPRLRGRSHAKPCVAFGAPRLARCPCIALHWTPRALRVASSNAPVFGNPDNDDGHRSIGGTGRPQPHIMHSRGLWTVAPGPLAVLLHVVALALSSIHCLGRAYQASLDNEVSNPVSGTGQISTSRGLRGLRGSRGSVWR